MSSKPVTRPYELALLRAVFVPTLARKMVGAGTSKLFGDTDTKALYRTFQKMHFDRVQVTRDSLLLEIQAAAVIDDENAVILIDEILALPEPEKIDRLMDGLGKLRSRAMLFDLKEYLGTDEAVRDGMAGAVVKINEFTQAAHIVSSKAPETMSEVMDRIMERTEPAKVWVPGLGKLDDYWKIRKGSYGVIGADSGAGKTALAINLALSIARQDTHVGFISIEMTADEVIFRAAAIEAGVDASRVEDNLLSDAEKQQVYHVMRVNKAIYDRIHVIDPAFLAVEDMHARYNELITRNGCEVIITDYLQRIGSKDKALRGTTERVSHVSETITAITKATGVASIVLSVLARDSSIGKSAKKGLDHLKHSGQIGHDAHWVVILTPQEGQDLYAAQKMIICESVKNRKGQFFVEPLLLDGPTQRITHSGGSVIINHES